MINRVRIEECIACGNCKEACPKNAIELNIRNKGFLYPSINEELCVECDVCEKVCPVINECSTERIPVKCLAVKSRDDNNRLKSTSGGVFYELSKRVIENGGYVCGAVFEGKTVKHILTDRAEDLEKIRGSKYAQSDLNSVFTEIKDKLKSGRQVLFGGCPCQANALRSFVGEEYNNLIIVDFVCHGIPSNEFLEEYLKLQENRYGAAVKQIRFRDKRLGWHLSSVVIEFENGKEYTKPIVADGYMKGFLGNTVLRESCYSCKSKSGKSGSDITLCDLWGAEVTLPDFDDNQGINGVLIYSENAIKLFDEDTFAVKDINYEQIVKYNRNINEPSERNANRETFYECMDEKGFEKAYVEFLEETREEEKKREAAYKKRCIKNKLLGKGRPLY